MPDNLRELLQHAMPFMVAAANSGETKLNKTRLIEAIIIAAIPIVLAWLWLIPELKAEFKFISRDVQTLSTDVHQMQKEIKQTQIDVVNDRFRRSDFDAWRKEHLTRDHAQ